MGAVVQVGKSKTSQCNGPEQKGEIRESQGLGQSCGKQWQWRKEIGKHERMLSFCGKDGVMQVVFVLPCVKPSKGQDPRADVTKMKLRSAV